MISVRALYLLATPVILMALLPACGGKNQNNPDSDTVNLSDTVDFIRIADAEEFLPGWSKENTLVYHTIAEPDVLHPTNGTSAMRTEIFQYTQMSLFRFDFRTLKIAPGLLKVMPDLNDTGTEYTCELRDDPRWDDDSPLTAEDVIFTAKANKCSLTDNPHAKPYWDNLQDIIPDKDNNRKFKVIMKRPYIHNLIFWADWPIIQRKFFDAQNEMAKYTFQQLDDTSINASANITLSAWANSFNDSKYSRELNFLSGIGMYRVAAWDPGQSVTLQRKENHWTKNSNSIYESSYPDKIIYRINKDPNSTMLDFKGQVMDGTNLIPTKSMLELQADSGFNKNYYSRFTDTFNYTYIGMNNRPDGVKHKKIFTDKSVRRAMALLTPVDDLNRVINKGKNKRMVGPVSMLKKDFDPSLKPLPYDVEQAKKLLADAGWKDTDADGVLDKSVDGEKIKFEFALNYMTNTPDWKDYATMLSEAYAKAGIKANLNPLDFSIFVANAKKHDFDMMIAVWGSVALPEDFTQLWHTSSWTTEGSNYPGFGNAESDALIDSIKITLDDTRRSDMSKRFQKIVYDEQPMIFLFSSLRRNVMHKRFGNVEMYFERPGILLNNLRLISLQDNPNP